MRSVSTFGRSIGAATAVRVVKRLHRRLPASACAHVGELPGDRRGRGHGRAHRGACARPCPGGPRSCGSRSRRSARPARRRSPFMPTHIEQPGSRHSKPASREDRGRALRPRPARFTRPEPGTTNAGTTAVRPVATAAAARRSSMRLFVHEPMKTRSIGDVGQRRARARGPCRRAPAPCSRAAPASAARAGSGTRPVIGSGVLRARAPRHHRRELARIEAHLAVEHGAGVGGQRAPVARAPAPTSAPLRRVRAGPRGTRTSSRRARPCRRARRPRSTCCRPSCALPSTCARDRRAGVLDGVAGAAAGADLSR